MATEADHLVLANKNHQALLHLVPRPEDFSEWIATIAFYKALQVVEAVFVRRGYRASDHNRRFELLKTSFPEIYRHFRVLWQASTIARYLHDNESNRSYSQFSDYLSPARVVEKLVFRRLRPIEELAVSHLSEAGRQALVRVPAGAADQLSR